MGKELWLLGVLLCGLLAGAGGVAAAAAAVVGVATLPPPAAQRIEFVRDIEPLLARSCYGCHGAEKQENGLRWDVKSGALRGGTSGPAIVPGKSAESRMIHLVAGLEKGLIMPQKGERLTPAEIGLLRAWIDQGANWPDGLNPIAKADDKAKHWAFQPATRAPVPVVKHEQWVRNSIDRFILARLEQEKLSPSPEAERGTLIRRVTYDLIGLPPTPEEVQAFLADRSSAAYDKLVDRLLASPRYGERWARYWLDIVHFGETHGYDKDKVRPNAWPYRDYVIRAFNEDKGYGRFVQEQLAGDVLFPEEPEGIVAMGFIAAGPWDYVGHVELPITKTDGLIARYNDRDDMVMTAMSTFQSLTVHCARCHNHKFDPITQKDYYNLQAVFAGVDRANRPYDEDKATLQQRRSLTAEKQKLEARQKELNDAVAQLVSPELKRIDARRVELSQQLAGAPVIQGKRGKTLGYHSLIVASPDMAKWVQVDLGQSWPLDAIVLVPAFEIYGTHPGPGFGFPARFRVDVSEDAKFEKFQTVADQTGADYPHPGNTPYLVKASGKSARYIRVTATRLWKRTEDWIFALGEMLAFSGSKNVAAGATVAALDSIEAAPSWGKKNLVDGESVLAFAANDKNSTNRSAVELLQALSQTEQWQGELRQLSAERTQVIESLLDAGTKAELKTVATRLADVNKSLAALPARKMVYAAANDFSAEGSFTPANGVRPVHLLLRGDVKRPAELASPAPPSAVPGPVAKFELADASDEGARRAALAKWITDPKNMLTRRSIVNRIWQYHFGKGIVDSPNDFGHMGATPSHPELLDWLAYQFLDDGESIKHLHKLIVTSATYRQSSANRAASARLDGDNRFLWRMNRTRIDAECIHDALLCVSGKMDFQMGGPSVRQFFFKDDHSPVYDYTRFNVDSPEAHRRSIYRLIVRSVTDPFMDCLDCADPSLLVPKRNTTLTALQALATLNNPFVLRQCEHFAERLRRLSPDATAQIEAAYQLALCRKPTIEESQALAAYAQKHGLANACRVIFNSTEFMFVD